LFNFISFGEKSTTSEVTIARMNKEEPSSTEIPMCIPSAVAPSEADKLAKTSGAPAPKANRVTPAKL
jgi:hypothetical protein